MQKKIEKDYNYLKLNTILNLYSMLLIGYALFFAFALKIGINKNTDPASVKIVIFSCYIFIFTGLCFTGIVRIKLRDIKARRKSLKKKRAQKLHRYISSLSHELKNPINIIIGYSNFLLEKKGGSGLKERELINIIRESAVYLLGITNGMTDHGKGEATGNKIKKEKFNFQDFLKTTLDMISQLACKKGLKVVFRQKGDFPELIVGDHSKLRQILLNLLINAVRYTPEGYVGLEVHAQKGELEFRVFDSGPGIAAHDKQTIFNPFVQLRDSGTNESGVGLGLFISDYLVNLMGGNLGVESRPGKGSVFYFSLGYEEFINREGCMMNGINKNYMKIKGYRSRRGGDSSLRVLLVDDQKINLMFLSRLLVDSGLYIDEAMTGDIALKLCLKNRYDLVIMDLFMPEIDGFEVAFNIKSKLKDESPKMIAVSGDSNKEIKEKAFRAGFASFIAKPFDYAELYALLEEFLEIQLLYDV